MTAYYNENDPKAAAWLRSLMDAELIPAGVVDERSIADVRPQDLYEFEQCHFFAGIGGWAYALHLAEWPKGVPVWTGSCPCQPFSVAGKRKGTKDERHLWPEFERLIAECGPAIVFGEQVASKDGRLWLDRVRVEMEALGYAVGAADLCAAGVNAPHIRQRLWWVAYSQGQRGCWWGKVATGCGEAVGRPVPTMGDESWFIGGPSCESICVSDVLLPSYGIPGRVAQLRGLGNAIVPQVAAEFIQAFIEVINGQTQTLQENL